MKKSSIRDTMLQRSRYTVALLLEQMKLSENDHTKHSLTARQSADNAMLDFVLEKCVRFDMRIDESTATEHGIVNVQEQVNVDGKISVSF